MISGPQRKFCEGIVKGLNQTEAYQAAYPKASYDAAAVKASNLVRKGNIQEEIQRLRDKADKLKGSAVLCLAEKRAFVARLVRCKVGEEPHDSDLWNSVKITEDGREYKIPDKLRAIEIDNDLAGEGSAAEADDAVSQALLAARK